MVECPDGDCTGIRATQGPGGTTVIERWVIEYAQSTIGGVTYPGEITGGHWETVGRVGDFWPRRADYLMLEANVGTIVGGTLTVAIDSNGHVYAGVGPNVGKSLRTFSFSASLGWMVGGVPSASGLSNFLTGWGCSAGGGYVPGYFFGWSSGGQANTLGGASPQVGVSCTYSLKLW